MSSILLLNGSFKNKGDALMIRAVEERLGPGHDWSISASIAAVSPREAERYRICTVSDLGGQTRKQRVFNAALTVASGLAKILPGMARSVARLLHPSKVDVAFDVNGYCFGDFWGPEKIEQCTRNYRALRAGGAKVVLMPRTWGPFERIDPGALDRMIQNVDLAFARDRSSFEAITRAVAPAQREKIFFAPDYTHAVSPPEGGCEEQQPRPLAWLIPNNHVVSSGTMGFDDYLALLATARRLFIEAGLHPKMLIHESSNDLRYVESAERIGFGSGDVVIAKDALEAKCLIAQADAVVTSALHGLYNALNSVVPVGVIPWNFKYPEALKQYHCPECAVDMMDADRSLAEVIRLITEPVSVRRLKSAIARGKAEQNAATEAMWQRIGSTIGLGTDSGRDRAPDAGRPERCFERADDLV